jgi:hypothetical protein
MLSREVIDVIGCEPAKRRRGGSCSSPQHHHQKPRNVEFVNTNHCVVACAQGDNPNLMDVSVLMF